MTLALGPAWPLLTVRLSTTMLCAAARRAMRETPMMGVVREVRIYTVLVEVI